MPFSTLKAYKDATIQVLVFYQKDYYFFNNKHEALTKDLEKMITQSKTREDLSEILYKNYCNVLKKDSLKLAKQIAKVLAQEWDLFAKDVERYHKMRKTPRMILVDDALWFTQKIHQYYGEKRLWDCLRGTLEKFDAAGRYAEEVTVFIYDPIIAFRENIPIFKESIPMESREMELYRKIKNSK